jgi:hypothetical protein
MLTRKLLVSLAAVTLMMTGTARGGSIEQYEAEFTSFASSDAGAVSPVTSSTGHTPAGDFTVTFVGGGGQAPKGTDWLTQGLIGGSPETAKFSHPGTGGAGSGRARFAAPLTSSMTANDGVNVIWSARYGDYPIGRGPIQIAVWDDGSATGTPYTVYYRVQDGTTLQILQNGGQLYVDIDELTIPDVADGEYHTWESTVKVDSETAYWDLQLDGEQLLFSGADGNQTLDGTLYSFRTSSEAFTPISQGSGAYIGLGELNTQEVWDFEFDYVRWGSDAGTILLGDVNGDGNVNGLDVDPFVDVLLNGPYQAAADMNQDTLVNGLDVDPFVAAVVGGGAQAVPEPSAIVLVGLAGMMLAAGGLWRKRSRSR